MTSKYKKQIQAKYGKEKDPAFLFYPSDFFRDTSDLNFEDKGKYIQFICIQHAIGHLDSETINIQFPNGLSEKLKNKLTQDENGKYYLLGYERRFLERELYIETKSQNGKKGGAPLGNKNAQKNKLNTIENQPNGIGNGNESVNDNELRNSHKESSYIRLNAFKQNEVFFYPENGELKLDDKSLILNKRFAKSISEQNINSLKTALEEFNDGQDRNIPQINKALANFFLRLLMKGGNNA